MFFGRKNKTREDYEDPVTRYGRMLRNRKDKQMRTQDKPSLLSRIFGSGHDSDFVFHDE